MKRAIVLGGGIAGIAAAFALRDRGLDVLLLESHGWLGGRAFSLPAHGMRIAPDNGPHVMLGCYEHMRALLRRIGSEDAFDRPPALQLTYADATGNAAELALARLPVPLALPVALLRLRALPFGARLRALRAIAAVPLGARPNESLGDWLARRGQRGAPRAWLWDPLCRSIMNAEAEDVSAALFLGTLRRAFQGRAADAAIWAARRPWSEIVGVPAGAQLAREGVAVRCGWRVTALATEGERVRSIAVDRHGALEVDGDTLVCSALPWHALAHLVGDGVPELAASPIVSIHFEVDGARGLPREPVVVLVDGDPFHFYCRAPGAPDGTFALLAGGCKALDGVAPDEVERRARAQLARHFPRAELPHGITRVVKEARATFVPSPQSEALRPAPGRHARLTNLLVCGDWTATGLPSTLEGAAASGVLAARGVGLVQDRARAGRAGAH